MTHLVNATKLKVTSKVLLIESLQTRVEESTKQWTLNLLHDLCTSLLRIVFCDDRAESVVVHVVFLRELVR